MKEIVIILAISAVYSYLLGGINGAIIFSKICYGEDIRTKGSNNPGFTNFKRVYGLNIVSWSVLLTDILKAALPVFITAFLLNKFGMWQFGAAYSGLFCMIGHCFPIWYKFKGGKAFIAGFATTWFVDYRMALIATVIFFAVLLAFKYMSIASCVASLSCPITLAIIEPESYYTLVFCALSALLVIIRHTPNFIKLSKGIESKFSFHN